MHYYYFDFCYFGTLITYVFLFFFWDSHTLYYACFAFSTGPMAQAVILTRNSLVFHDFGLLSGLLLHLMPSKNLWALHWFAKHSKDGFMGFDLPTHEFSFENALIYLKAVYTVYFLWLIVYYILVFRVKDSNYETTFELVMKSSRSIKAFVYQFGNTFAPFVFIGIHIVFMSACFVVSLIFFFNFYLHTLWLFFVIGWGAKNGASYYIDYFSKKYEKSIVEVDELTWKVEEAIQKKGKRG